MHVADQVLAEAFEVQIGGERVGPEAVFPDWSRLDRFGIVVTEPLGGLGASLLLQRWADVVERRVDEVPQPVRDHVAEALAARLRSGELVEAYRRITSAEALAYIAGGF
jgi:hypothetical protein